MKRPPPPVISSGAQSVVAELPLHLGLHRTAEFHFLRYKRFPHVKQRVIAKKSEREIVAAWLRHEQLEAGDFVTLSTIDVDHDRLKKEAARATRGGRMLALSSTCILASGRTAHIPLMDFKCKPTPKQLRLLVEALRQLEMPGVVLRTDASFHFYGFALLTSKEWRAFTATCLLFRSLVDWRYVGHCLLRGMSSVRIQGDRRTGLAEPTVAAHVNCG
jgi:hypothetical protein